jgi:hypothetical protein
VRLVLGLGFAVMALGVGATTTAGRLPSITCDDHISILTEQPPPVDTFVLGRVRLPRPDEVLQLGPPASRGAPSFAKRGLTVTAGTPIVLEVPRRYRRLYGLAFGGGSGRLGNRAVRVQPCPGYAMPRTSWAGGYMAWKPVCVQLVVRANGRTARVPLSLGRKCARITR